MYYVEWGDRCAMFDCFEQIEAWRESINCEDEARALAEEEKEKLKNQQVDTSISEE